MVFQSYMKVHLGISKTHIKRLFYYDVIFSDIQCPYTKYGQGKERKITENSKKDKVSHFPGRRHEWSNEPHELVLEYGGEVELGARGAGGRGRRVERRNKDGEALKAALLRLGGGCSGLGANSDERKA